MELVLLLLFIGAMFGLVFLIIAIDVAANRAIKTAQAAAINRPMPSKIKSLVELKAGFAPEDLINIFVVQRSIDELNLNQPMQSSLSLTNQKANYNGVLKMIYQTKKSKLFPLIILFCIPLGFVPFILYTIIGAIMYQGASKYEELMNRFMAGQLGRDAIKPNSLSQELSSLLDLKTRGVLSDAEFEKAKAKLLAI